jgi:hypothetical protein
VSPRYKFAILLGIVTLISAGYYLMSTDRDKDLVLVGTVDSNQVVVSPQIQGRIQKLLVDEGTQVKNGDLIAILDPSELEAHGNHCKPSLQGGGDAIHRAIHSGGDFQRRDECAGSPAVGARAAGPGRGQLAAGGERQPTHH